MCFATHMTAGNGALNLQPFWQQPNNQPVCGDTHSDSQHFLLLQGSVLLLLLSSLDLFLVFNPQCPSFAKDPMLEVSPLGGPTNAQCAALAASSSSILPHYSTLPIHQEAQFCQHPDGLLHVASANFVRSIIHHWVEGLVLGDSVMLTKCEFFVQSNL